MHRYLRWAFIAAGVAVPLGVAGFFLGMRQAPLTPAQQRALQLMNAPTPPVQGKDASDALWLLDFDLPAESRAENAAKLRQYGLDLAQGKPGLRDPSADWPRFPKAPANADEGCFVKPGNCLAYVTGHRAEVAALLDDHRPGVEAVRELSQFDGYRHGVELAVASSVPLFTMRRDLLLSDFALRFAAGERITAVDQVCQDLGGWRRIGGDADFVLVGMIGASFVGQDLTLLADMLRQLPKETELPASCTGALAPARAGEFDLCPAMRSEFGQARGLPKELERQIARNDPETRGDPPMWAVDWRRLEARTAESFAPYCDPALPKRAMADELIGRSLPAAPECTRWEALADPWGCDLARLGTSASGRYIDRRADQAQMLALMRTVVWLRAEADSKEAVADALQRRPKELGLLRTPAYDLENDRLSIPLHDRWREGTSFVLAAGAEPRPTSRRKHCCSRRPSRNLASAE